MKLLGVGRIGGSRSASLVGDYVALSFIFKSLWGHLLALLPLTKLRGYLTKSCIMASSEELGLDITLGKSL